MHGRGLFAVNGETESLSGKLVVRAEIEIAAHAMRDRADEEVRDRGNRERLRARDEVEHELLEWDTRGDDSLDDSSGNISAGGLTRRLDLGHLLIRKHHCLLTHPSTTLWQW